MNLPAQLIHEYLHYDADSGLFFWKVNKYRAKAGTIAGGLTSTGYVEIRFYQQRTLGHRLAWFMVTGEWPEHEVDHINRNRSDNAWTNLRPATHAQNCANRAKYNTNTSGLKGVTWNKNRNKWVAQITANYKNKGLGYFNTKEAAYAAYIKAATELHGEFHHG